MRCPFCGCVRFYQDKRYKKGTLICAECSRVYILIQSSAHLLLGKEKEQEASE